MKFENAKGNIKLAGKHKNEIISVDTLKEDYLIWKKRKFLEAVVQGEYEVVEVDSMSGLRKSDFKKLISDMEELEKIFKIFNAYNIDWKANQFLEEFAEQVIFELNEGYFGAFNQLAPHGCYYGSQEGDGACFGFWEYEEE